MRSIILLESRTSSPITANKLRSLNAVVIVEDDSTRVAEASLVRKRRDQGHDRIEREYKRP